MKIKRIIAASGLLDEPLDVDGLGLPPSNFVQDLLSQVEHCIDL